MNQIKNEQLAAMAQDLRSAPATSMIGTHVMLSVAKGAAIALALESIVDERNRAWINAEIAPNVKTGDYDYFWIAVRRKGREKVVTFPAVYCNAYGLCTQDPCDASGPHWSQVETDPEKEDGDIKVTGWYDIKASDGEYDTVYEPVCNKGDVIVAWQRGPEFPA